MTRPNLTKRASFFQNKADGLTGRFHFRLDILCFLSRAYNRGRERPEIRQASFMFRLVCFMSSLRYSFSASLTTLCRYSLNGRRGPDIGVTFITVSFLWFVVCRLWQAKAIFESLTTPSIHYRQIIPVLGSLKSYIIVEYIFSFQAR
jgi:hypothetical protein